MGLVLGRVDAHCVDPHLLRIFGIVLGHTHLLIFCYSFVSVKKMLFLLEESLKSLLGVAPSGCSASMATVFGWLFAAGLDDWFGWFDCVFLLWARVVGYW